jgi:hypothetical protein
MWSKMKPQLPMMSLDSFPRLGKSANQPSALVLFILKKTLPHQTIMTQLVITRTQYVSGICGLDVHGNGCHSCASFNECADSGKAPKTFKVGPATLTVGWRLSL